MKPKTTVEPNQSSDSQVEDEPFPAVIFVSGDGGPNGEIDTAIVAACAQSKTAISGDAHTCANLVSSSSRVSSIKDGKVIELGKRFGAYCSAGLDGVQGSAQDAFAITLPKSPYGRFLVYPTSRARDVKLADISPSIDKGKLADLTRSAASALRDSKIHGQPYHLEGDVAVTSVLRTDVDGDSVPDIVYSLDAPTPKDSSTYFSLILGQLSTKHGALVPMLVDQTALTELVGSIDLNRDGTDELLVVSNASESGAAYVEKYDGHTLKIIGGYSCGL